MDRELILEALKVIMKVCEEAGDCCICPLRGEYDSCMLECKDAAPMDWCLADTHDNWRAFR